MYRFQTYRPEVKRFLARALPVLALLVAFTGACLILPAPALAFGPPNSSNAPKLGQPPEPNAGWQADQVDREGAWWKAGRPQTQGTPSTNLPQGTWAFPGSQH